MAHCSHHSSIVHCLHPVTSCKACRCAFDQRSVGIWERDQLWVWSHRKFWKKRDGASWFWEILFPFAGAPAKCRRNGQFRHILTAIRVGQTAKVLKIRSSFGPVCGIYNGAQMGNDRQTEPEFKRCGPTRVRDRCINASVTCDPRQNKIPWALSRVHKNKSMQHHTLRSGTAEFQVTWPPKLREGTYLVKKCTSTLWVSKDHRRAWKTCHNARKGAALR